MHRHNKNVYELYGLLSHRDVQDPDSFCLFVRDSDEENLLA